jgi:hypothetical protein
MSIARRIVMAAFLLALGLWQMKEYVYHGLFVLLCGAIVFIILALNELVVRRG